MIITGECTRNEYSIKKYVSRNISVIKSNPYSLFVQKKTQLRSSVVLFRREKKIYAFIILLANHPWLFTFHFLYGFNLINVLLTTYILGISICYCGLLADRPRPSPFFFQRYRGYNNYINSLVLSEWRTDSLGHVVVLQSVPYILHSYNNQKIL